MNKEFQSFEKEIKKSSKKAAFITAIGAILILISLLIGVTQLFHLNERIKEEEQSSNKQIEVLKQNVKTLKTSVQEINKTIEVSKSSEIKNIIKTHIPISAIVAPHASAKELKGVINQKGQQVYNFAIWVDIPEERRLSINKVTYEFNHPTFKDKIYESTGPANNFKVEYKGWGCLTSIIITLFQKDGQSSKIDFDMCKDIGWK